MWYVRAEPEAMTVRHAHAARPHWILTLGDQVKRFAITLCGVVGGLLLTWFYLYTYSHISWPKLPSTPARGCYELDKCPVSWWQGGCFSRTCWGLPCFSASSMQWLTGAGRARDGVPRSASGRYSRACSTLNPMFRVCLRAEVLQFSAGPGRRPTRISAPPDRHHSADAYSRRRRSNTLTAPQPDASTHARSRSTARGIHPHRA